MSWPVIALLAAAALLAIAGGFISRRAFRPIASRPSAEGDWQDVFPAASQREIRDFLQRVGDALGTPGDEALKLRPNDAVTAVYRRLNAVPWNLGDAMELENLALELQDRYGLDLLAIWREDLTLGEIFERSKAVEPPRQSTRNQA